MLLDNCIVRIVNTKCMFVSMVWWMKDTEFYVRIHRYIHGNMWISDCICNNMNGNVILYVILKDWMELLNYLIEKLQMCFIYLFHLFFLKKIHATFNVLSSNNAINIIKCNYSGGSNTKHKTKIFFLIYTVYWGDVCPYKK